MWKEVLEFLDGMPARQFRRGRKLDGMPRRKFAISHKELRNAYRTRRLSECKSIAVKPEENASRPGSNKAGGKYLNQRVSELASWDIT